MVKVIDADITQVERQAGDLSAAAQDARDSIFRMLGTLPPERHAALNAQWEALLDRIEDMQAGLAYLRGEGEEYLPMHVVERLLDKESPLLVWREHRGLTVRALAEKAGVSPSLVSEIETGKKEGSIATLKALARALDLTLDDLAG